MKAKQFPAGQRPVYGKDESRKKKRERERESDREIKREKQKIKRLII